MIKSGYGSFIYFDDTFCGDDLRLCNGIFYEKEIIPIL